ncbi:MAG: type II toxin-antitoxin system RelB/DinJ family antitoxin [Candidatus Saccharibacteria bacterium]|nr:type II toxin-antitoxin system RelB/DinJ family antitoxin [Candidatus Saccharibacteria bacterium]
MITTTNVTIRMDKDLKTEADNLFEDLGINFSTAINMFIKKCVREDRIPFEISRQKLNEETIDALIEAENIAQENSQEFYTNMRNLMSALED